MSKLERAFVSSADAVWKKVKASDGKTMHFRDGVPKTEQAFNSATQHSVDEGEKVRVAVPSNKGPGYERKKVMPTEASALGQQLRLSREDVRGQAQATVMIEGEEYYTKVLANLNKRITQSHGPDAVMMY